MPQNSNMPLYIFHIINNLIPMLTNITQRDFLQILAWLQMWWFYSAYSLINKNLIWSDLHFRHQIICFAVFRQRKWFQSPQNCFASLSNTSWVNQPLEWIGWISMICSLTVIRCHLLAGLISGLKCLHFLIIPQYLTFYIFNIKNIFMHL